MTADRKEQLEKPEDEAGPSFAAGAQPWLMKSVRDLQSSINKVDDRLRRVEKIVWVAIGGLAVIVFLTA